MAAEVLLRPYRAEDLPQLVDLFRQTVHEVNRRDYTPGQLRAWAPDDLEPADWTARFAAKDTLVAQIGERIVGFSDLEPDGHIDMMFVHKDHQGQGIATRLLTAIEAEARRRGLLRLYTEASITARPFFERHGFSVITARSVPLGDQVVTNYRMEKALG